MAEDGRDQVVRRAGRGFVFILAAKLYFLFAGYAIIVALSWILGPVLYGVYGLVVGAISVLDNVIVTGTIQAVSRFTAEAPDRVGPVKAAALKLQVLLGGSVATAFALGAPLVAWFERDLSLTPYLRLAAGIVLFYAFYSVFVGSANGTRRFGLQAGLDSLYVTMRGALIVALAAAGLGVWGAISGFVAASFLILLIAAAAVGVRDIAAGFPVRRLALFVLPVMAYLLLVNLAMFVDLFLLKRLALDALSSLPDPGEATAHAVGVYVAVQQLARVTYQALLAVTFVVFPLVSRSTFDRDVEATRSYVGSTMRYSLIFGCLVAVVMTALPSQVMGLPFGRAYLVGSGALAVLAPAYALFSLFVVATTILNAAGRLASAFTATAVTVAVALAAAVVLIPRAGSTEGVLLAAATASCVAMLAGYATSVVALRRALGAPVGWASLLRVGIAFGAAVGLGSLLPDSSRLVTLGECGVVALAYLAVLVVTRELGRDDLKRATAVLGIGR